MTATDLELHEPIERRLRVDSVALANELQILGNDVANPEPELARDRLRHARQVAQLLVLGELVEVLVEAPRAQVVRHERSVVMRRIEVRAGEGRAVVDETHGSL